MNLNQLRFVQAVAKHQSFSRAAENCHVTQPTLSNGLAQLEDELGGKLFDRTTRSVNLTPFGKHLLSGIERTLADHDEIHAMANAWRNPQHKLIRIGLSPIVNIHFLVDLFAPFRNENTEVELFYKECFIGDLETRLRDRELDIAFLPPRQKQLGLLTIDLYSEPLLYVPRAGGPLSESENAIRIEEAASEVIILTMDGCGLRPVTQQIFKDAELKIKEYPGQATNYRAVEEWASLGIGGGILPQSKISDNNLSSRPLLLQNNEPAMVSIQLIYQNNISGGEHLETFIEFLNQKSMPLLNEALI